MDAKLLRYYAARIPAAQLEWRANQLAAADYIVQLKRELAAQEVQMIAVRYRAERAEAAHSAIPASDAPCARPQEKGKSDGHGVQGGGEKMSQSEADSGFTRLASLIEDIGADRYGHPLMAALHLCNDLAVEINRLRSERPAIPEGMEDLIRWVSEHPHPTEPISRVQMYRGDWTKLVAFLRAMLAAAPTVNEESK